MVEAYRTEISNFLVNKLRLELAQQGHVASGELLQSIKVTVREIVNGFEIQGRYLKYGTYVDRGRKAGGKKVPIDALIKWIRIKGLDLRGKSEKSVAFMIQRSIHKKGIPSAGGDKKLKWMTKTLEKNRVGLVSLIRQRTSIIIDLEVKNMAQRSREILQVA